MKKWIRQWLGIDSVGYPDLPDALDDRDNIITKIALVDCANGGKVITTERHTLGGWEHKVYMVPEDGSVLDMIATILVEARLK